MLASVIDFKGRKIIGSVFSSVYVNTILSRNELTVGYDDRVLSRNSLIGYSFSEVDSKKNRILEVWSVWCFQ